MVRFIAQKPPAASAHHFTAALSQAQSLRGQHHQRPRVMALTKADMSRLFKRLNQELAASTEPRTASWTKCWPTALQNRR